MKKLFSFLCAAAVLVSLAACGGVSSQSFGIEYNGVKVCAGDTVSREETRAIRDNYEEILGLSDFKVNFGKVTDITLLKKNPDSEKVKILCGIQLGDNAAKIIDVMGKNKLYDEVKDDPNFTVIYVYYEDNGSIYGISDKVSTTYEETTPKDDAEKAYWESIEYKYNHTDRYVVTFYVREGKVDGVKFYYYDPPSLPPAKS